MAEIPRAEALEGAGRDFGIVKRILAGETEVMNRIHAEHEDGLHADQ